jgi:hypothetical protein
MSDQEIPTATSASDWKKTRQPVPLKVPSGNTCLVEPRSLDFWVRTGKVPNRLMPLAQRAVATGRDLTEEELWDEVNKDPAFLQEMMDMVDIVVVFQVKQPVVHPTPADPTGRDPEKLYVDEVDLNDKMAVFAFVTGGVRDLESFLQEQASDVPALPDREGLEGSAVESAGNRG